MNYEPVIGLEVHLQLKTKTKAFCGCSTEFGNPANTQVCPVCLGFPGSLPALNTTALDYAIKVALALNCQVQEFTKFDRKNYFYPDLPKNYQISQFDLPLSKNGFLEIEFDGATKRVGITRVHLEEDAGKLIHREDRSLLDFNRTGIPLLEIVSEPDINSAGEAYEYLVSLKALISYLDVSDCDMEKGSLRCDANISLHKKNEPLGTKIELKNMNSFKAVKEALNFEIKRQGALLEGNKKIIQETRLWDAECGETLSMRTKEGSQDYRYFPEPDLPPFIISKEKIEKIKSAIPELPREKKARLVREYSLSGYDAGILVFSRKDADFFEDLVKQDKSINAKAIANWLIGPLTSIASNSNLSISDVKIPGGNVEFLKLIKFVEAGLISNLMAKSVLNESIATGAAASTITQNKNLFQISDFGQLESHVDEAIKENPGAASDYKKGKPNAVMFLVGAVMKKTGGKANPKSVKEILLKKLVK